MNIQQTDIAGVLVIEPKKFGDERGFFSETYRKEALAEVGFSGDFIQDNHAVSSQIFTVRGLHFQTEPFAQDKLLRVTRGAILDVAVDLRETSPTFGQHVAVELSARNWRQLLVPKGFAHGYQTLTEECEVLYKVTRYFAPQAEGGLLWNDPALGIAWTEADPAKVVVNNRDAAWPTLANLQHQF